MTIASITTKALKQLLGRLGVEPTNEAYLADALGLSRRDIRARLEVCRDKGLAREIEENPGHWIKAIAMPLSDAEIYEAIAAYGSLGVNLYVLCDKFDLGVQELRHRLRKLEASGQLKSRDGEDEWFLAPPTPIEAEIVTPIPVEGAVGTDDELSYDEERLLLQLERDVEKSFQKAGLALARIRDQRLYRNRFKDFESYCHQRFGISKSYAYRQIAAIRIVEELATAIDDDNEKVSPMGDKKGDSLNAADQNLTPMGDKNIPLPVSERQIRPLATLLPGDRLTAWKHAVESSGGRIPTEQAVRQSVEQVKQEAAVRIQPNPFVSGEVALAGSKWVVIGETTDRTCVCGTFNGYEQIHYCELQKSDYTDEQADFLRQYQPLLSDTYTSAESLPYADKKLVQSVIKALASSMAIGHLSECASQVFDLLQILTAE